MHVGGGEFQQMGGNHRWQYFKSAIRLQTAIRWAEMVMLEGNQAPAIFIQRKPTTGAPSNTSFAEEDINANPKFA